ncbi:hypothetical protein NDU88_004979 [Pleurodeles waltl]|uniref:Uncharacterized protein n=1 Tax=Pleurodeles waltl TaxID=8319 RepID=A0AAV7LW70_PLEWA|nr:hypothetical protein NDU88_004979 [Pleurodeles waltl]
MVRVAWWRKCKYRALCKINELGLLPSHRPEVLASWMSQCTGPDNLEKPDGWYEETRSGKTPAELRTRTPLHVNRGCEQYRGRRTPSLQQMGRRILWL